MIKFHFLTLESKSKDKFDALQVLKHLLSLAVHPTTVVCNSLPKRGTGTKPESLNFFNQIKYMILRFTLH